MQFKKCLIISTCNTVYSSLLTLSYTAHQYNKYKQYTRTGRLTGECGRSVHTMISTSNLH